MTTPIAARGKRVTASHISMTLRRMVFEAMDELGGKEYLKRIALEDPAAFLQYASKCIKVEDGSDAAGLTIVIRPAPQYLGPIPGVLNSPVVEHIGPPRLVARQGATIDMETGR